MLTERAAGARRGGRRCRRSEDEVIDSCAGGRVEAVARAAASASPTRSPNFDAATIETTHGFCQKVLDGLGTLGRHRPDVTFVDNVDDLVARGRRRPLRAPLLPRPRRSRSSRRRPSEVARVAIDNPTRADLSARAAARLDGGDALPAGGRRPRRARRAQARGSRLMTYDDQLTRLLATLAGPRGADAVARLRDQLPRRPDRRVPGHRPDPVGDRRARVRHGGERARLRR